MAINSINVLGGKNPTRSLCTSKTCNLSCCRLIKINFAGKNSCSSSRAHGRNINKDIKSPYFANDKVQVLSRVTADKIINKKPNEFISSFPLAARVYKANSDEFKLKKRGSNKVKKSVLTLPNEPVLMPKTYTVSDLNDPEYFNAVNDGAVEKSKKRRSVKRIKKCRVKEPVMEFCDRDSRYCSQLNIDLDCSSSQIVNFTGDGQMLSKLSYKSNNSVKAGKCPHDVWTVLRNLNKFRPSPPSSLQSIPLRKRRPIIRKNNNSNDTHFFETCRTEEFAYISRFEVGSKTRDSHSPSSSFDRVTVIDKQSEQDAIVQQFSRNMFGSNLNVREKIKTNINTQVRGRNKCRLKNSNKKDSHAKKNMTNYHAIENYTHNKASELEAENVAVENCNDLLLPEVLSKTASIFKPRENYSDTSSIKENYWASMDQTNNFLKDVRSGDISKNNNIKSLTKSPDIKDKVMKAMGDSEKQLNGITRVIFGKGKETVSPKLSDPQRKPRLALTLPNTNIPKLSRLETKRRLANKFPIVILGKDQLTNHGIYVANVDPPQFDGLDKHIWPFMWEWSEEKFTGNNLNIQENEVIKSKNAKFKNKAYHHDNVNTKFDDFSNPNIVSKKAECQNKENTLHITNKQIELASEVSSPGVQKSKPLIYLKNKMFHFLHKNPISPKLIENDLSNNQRIEIVLKNKQVGTSEATKNYNTLNNKCSLVRVHLKDIPDKPVENRVVSKSYFPLRHPWAKGKWASDFIENVIKKIRSGVYYSVDRKENKHRTNCIEVSTQTEINVSKNAYCQNGADFDFALDSIHKNDDPLKNIPGFDKTLTTLEIETISTNKIAVKHCVTNIVVHFDIQVFNEPKNSVNTKKSMSCMPIDIKSNEEKVFKCNTSIINSILPAELCTIIPTMMRNILDVENKLRPPSTTVKNVLSHSIAQSEFIEPKRAQRMNSLIPGFAISNEIKMFLNGQFRSSHLKSVRINLHCPVQNTASAGILLPRVNTQILRYYRQPSVNLHAILYTSNRLIEKPDRAINRLNNFCSDLQLYEPKKISIVPFTGPFNMTDFMRQIVDRTNVNQFTIISNDLTACYNINIIISKPLLFPRGENKNIESLPVSDSKVGVISLFNAFKKINQYTSEYTVEINVHKKENIPGIPSNDSRTVTKKKGQPVKAVRKKSYVKFYRKCNSMSCISSYKCTPLNKVTNLEDFCQVLGSNLYSNVLDGRLEKKILGAIEEMKNWITDISPKQALIVLLLTNKKDTPNLIRFRPVLLQGIAVNRITKADELDTEIEVIEKENFKLSQYEGISYLPANPKNRDSLLEELYWIAKTTASDYQKTFDESSEKLLKSLLEKRKKLNPSYLRVMARYVGLGLLAPTKL